MSDLIINLNLKEVIKSMLFVSGDGVDISDISEKLEIETKTVKKAVESLKEELSGVSGIHLIQYKNKIQLSSNPDYAEAISIVLNPIRERALTKAALETMAIIAYKQPVTRLEIEDVRGVGCDYTVQLLMDHNLIEVVGRKDAVGKPLLFGTTEEFLKRFGLQNIDELPDYEDLLERIKLIHTEEEQSNSLYRDFELPDEEVPDFLQDEEGVEKINLEEKRNILEEQKQSRQHLEELEKKMQEKLKEFQDQAGDVLLEVNNA